MTFHVKQGGAWKESEVHVKHNGSWKRAEVWVKQSGTWKLVASVGPTFTPVPGTYSYEDYYDLSINVTCSETATWTWTKSGGGTVSIASGGTGTTLTFSVSATYNSSSGTYATRAGTLYLTATVGGVGYNFTITLTAMGDL